MATDTDKRILFIDDDPSVVPIVEAFLNDFLKSGSLYIEKAVSGEEGIQKMDALKPEIIFCDIKMPGVSGFEVCKAIRDSGWSSAFILMSACEEDEKKINIKGKEGNGDPPPSTLTSISERRKQKITQRPNIGIGVPW